VHGLRYRSCVTKESVATESGCELKALKPSNLLEEMTVTAALLLTQCLQPDDIQEICSGTLLPPHGLFAAPQ
jgi:hypothetical protein